MNYDWVLVIATFGVAAYAAWKLLPRALLLFFPDALTYRFEDGARPSPTLMLNDEGERQFQELKTRGFIYLGTAAEKPPLWDHGRRELSLVFPASSVFASLFMIRDKTFCSLLTPLSSGLPVRTANGPSTQSSHSETREAIVSGTDLKELLEAHLERVEALAKEGNPPLQDYSKEARIKAASLYFNSAAVRHRTRISGALYLFVFLLFCVPLIINIRYVI